MDYQIFIKWFDKFFYLAARQKSGPVLLLINTAPEHISGFVSDIAAGKCFPSDVTSWKQLINIEVI